jgi:DNA-binding LytR/AlgR family response regulator
MNVIVVEDEPLAAERLISLLHKTGESVTVLEVFDSIKETVLFISGNKKVDLIFLDIELADGKSFEIFKQVTVEAPIIFTTAYDQYALQAFKYLSIDYLLKPIQEDLLKNALSKFRRLENNTVKDKLDQLTQLISQGGNRPKERILVKSGNKLQYKSADEIAYFWAEAKEVYIFTRTENKKYLIDYTMEELERQLDKSTFFRVSRKAIINVSAIAEIKGLISTRLEVKLNQPCINELTVSRDRAADFKNWLDR